jgi:hypothetical protein
VAVRVRLFRLIFTACGFDAERKMSCIGVGVLGGECVPGGWPRHQARLTVEVVGYGVMSSADGDAYGRNGYGRAPARPLSGP